MTFRAKYPGRCAACGDDIEIEDHLDWSDDAGAAVHSECARAPRQSEIKPREVCPRCFIELPVSGKCGVCDPDEASFGVGVA